MTSVRDLIDTRWNGSMGLGLPFRARANLFNEIVALQRQLPLERPITRLTDLHVDMAAAPESANMRSSERRNVSTERFLFDRRYGLRPTAEPPTLRARKRRTERNRKFTPIV